MATTYDPTTADVGEVVKVPRGKLVIDPNVRQSVPDDKSFVSSIRVNGFEQYPVGWRDEDTGEIHITVGQRRTSAALEIGWEVVPIVIKPRVAAEGDRAEELRILTQLRENEQRAELTSHETAAAYQQLALFGVSEDQIARKTNSPRARVQTALKVASSVSASSAAEAHSLTLDQAAVIAEFDGDDEASAKLNEAATEDPEQLEHVAQRIREDRADQEVIDRLVEDIRAAGATPLTDWHEYNEHASRSEHISYLCRADDPDRAPLTADDLGGLENVFGWVRQGNRGDADRGFQIDWYVNGWKAQGLAQRYSAASAPVTEEEKEAERERKRAKREAKKAFAAATVVRREWIRSNLLGRGARHTEAHQAWIAGALLEGLGHLSAGRDRTRELAFELLGHENTDQTYGGDVESGESWVSPERRHASRVITVERASRVALAAAVAQTEAVVGNEKGDDFGRDVRTSRYLRQLRDWGYVLSDVERAIVTAADERIEAALADDSSIDDETDVADDIAGASA